MGGVRHGRRERLVPGMQRSKDGGLDDKALPRGGQDVLRARRHRHGGARHLHGLRPEYDQRVHNGRQLDNANAIWLRNWREVGLENARKTGGWCIQVLVAGGPSEMQRAEESMARSEGVPVIKLHLDKEQVGLGTIGPYLEALFEAMKTKPKAVERTITYYPEAVELKGTIKYEEDDRYNVSKHVFVRES